MQLLPYIGHKLYTALDNHTFYMYITNTYSQYSGNEFALFFTTILLITGTQSPDEEDDNPPKDTHPIYHNTHDTEYEYPSLSKIIIDDTHRLYYTDNKTLTP